MASIKDVANRAGLSVATVSRFFNEPEVVREVTRRKIQEAINALGYAPNTLARSFRSGSTRIVLVLSESISNALHGEIISGIVDAALPRGYIVRLQDPRQLDVATTDFVDLIASRQADGIVILGQAGSLSEKARSFQLSGLPIVVCGETSDPNLELFPRFEVNGRRAMTEMTQHLIGAGHRRIALITASIPRLELKQRELGYLDALAASGIPIDQSLIFDGHFRAQEARTIVGHLLSEPDWPTAIMCVTDEMAFGVLAELHARNVEVPNHVSVTGFDDTHYASLTYPPLTTVAQPARELGERGMAALLRLMAGKPIPEGVVYLDHAIVLRRSVAMLPST